MANISSAHFSNADATAFFDPGAQVFRICLAVAPTNVGTGATAYLSTPSPADSTQSLISTSSSAHASSHAQTGTPESQSAPAKQLRLPGKKSKVPRPPNAFILYRQKHHPLVKANQPHLVNNQISVILGKQWKQESEQVKAQYKAMANKLKAQHLAENPGYQYNPRKPSEKKRRMTARKLARLASESNSDLEMVDVADNDGLIQSDRMVADNVEHNVNEAAFFPEPTSATDILGSERSSYPTHLKHHRDDEMSLLMPTGHSQVEHDYMIKLVPNKYPVPFDNRLLRRQITTTQSPWSANADAFMNSIIDWKGIQADADIVRASTSEDISEAAAAELGEPVVAFDNEGEAVQFQRELERILWMLE